MSDRGQTNHAFTEDGGRLWKQQRKTAARIFTARNFRDHFMACFLHNGKSLLGVLEKAAKGAEDKGPDGGAIDAQDLFFRFTLDCICSLGLGVDLGGYLIYVL